ncbi:MAG: Flagellar biosynthetic protein FlhB [Proteobacteria bacterium]|nr:Flagellar biosynthetic protein FlhB [Pseudomonadota bacterium]
MAEDSDLEKTEEPTGRRLEQAREKGQVPQSRELGTFLVLMVGAASLWSTGGWLTERSLAIGRNAFNFDTKTAHEPAQMLVQLGNAAIDALYTFAPILGVLLLAAVISPLILNAWIFSGEKLMPDFGRLNPMEGIGRIFSWNSLLELLKAILKASLVGGIAAFLIWSKREEIFSLMMQPLEQGIAHAGHLMMFCFVVLVSVLAVVVAIDVPFQLWQYFDKLKMTKDEVKQEMKEMQGDPQVKGRIRSLQMQAARRRMMSAVPQADIIVTNPTHYSVALTYKAGMIAPKVVAKGSGEIAQKIREIAAEHGVPLLEAPPLARALYRHTEIDSEIPAALYTAVAEVLAYVYQLTQWKHGGGNYPLPPQDLPVPPELVPEPA